LAILVTGGVGFIGSHLIDALMTCKTSVCVFDNLSSGTLENVRRWRSNRSLTIVRGDLLNTVDLAKLKNNHFDVVYHLAANPEVRIGSTNPNIHFQQNVVATHNLLEHLRKTNSTPSLVFTSTSTVYGEATIIPTPEDYGPQMPISTYGASKLASEALISAYAHNYDFKVLILRLANIVGPRSRHGVIYDFARKLKKNPKELEILGNGAQTKSYLHISDCIKAMRLAERKSSKQVEIFNVGSEDQINVKDIAHIVIEEMKLKNVKLTITGGIDGGRGWKGDVKNMLLDINRLRSLGWKPKRNSKQAVRKATKHLIMDQ
jgi:UDP-glucose 4-epimerase